MEPVTHLLTGACLGRAGFNRTTALATLTMALAAEAPDLDIVWYLKGPIAGFEHHRGFSHTLLGTPIVAGLTVACVWIAYKLWRKLRHPKDRPGYGIQPPTRWGLLYLYACLAVLSHLLLDFTNNYGIRPFFPFDTKWYAWSIVFIVEPLLLAALIAALTFPHFFGLIGSEIGSKNRMPRGRASAIAALLFMAALWSFRTFERRQAIAAMEALDYNGQQAVRVFVNPYWINPFRWYGIVETKDFYQTFTVDSRKPEVDPDNRARTYYKPTDTRASLAAKNAWLGRVYLDWAQFPLVQSEPLENAGAIVRFNDLRFAYPERRAGALGAYVILNADFRPVVQSFNSNRPQQAETARPAP